MRIHSKQTSSIGTMGTVGAGSSIYRNAQHGQTSCIASILKRYLFYRLRPIYFSYLINFLSDVEKMVS